MPIDETALRQWADRHQCRSNLPILVRRLIRETTPPPISMRFPGNEAVDLSGLDGHVETVEATNWGSHIEAAMDRLEGRVSGFQEDNVRKLKQKSSA